MTDVVTGGDGVTRCAWAGSDPLYIAYHDEEWGRPLKGDDELFEMLVLEGFQAGLAWITVLRKREAFRAAFAGFNIASVARLGAADVDRLVSDAGIIRHRGKIVAAVDNARAARALSERGTSLEDLVWSFAPARRPRPASFADVPSVTPESTALSKELKRRGFRFVGPTIVYAFMQAVGMVDDHLTLCDVVVAPR
jgi:DNA-3-methyladenine glycosylase I